jgi:MFS family permease
MRTPGPVRTFLLASLQSSFGNAIGYVALLLLAFDRFHSAWAVSLVLLADFLPAIALAPLFGAFADRFSRRSLCVGADLLRCAACVGLSFAGSFTAIVGLALVVGVGTALYHPAAKSALAGLAAPHGDTAMGALVTVWSAASVAGPALAALLLLGLSPSDLLLVDALTFLASAVVLSRLPLDREEAAPPQHVEVPVAHGVRAGLRAARAVHGLSAVVGAGVAATLTFSLMNVAEPLLATEELDAGGVGFAVLVCVFGVGSTLGTLRGRADLRHLAWSLAGGGLLLGASAFAQSLAVAAITFLGTGVFAGAAMSSDHQLVARLAPAAIRGRVFGLKDSLDAVAFCTAFAGGGLLASLTDSRVVFAVSGVGALLAAALATMALRHTRVTGAAPGRQRGRQTGRRARGARRPAGF